MKDKIKVAIVGVGNCCASLMQGLEYYKQNGKVKQEEHLGLMNYDIGGYTPEDIQVVAAFDIDKRKVGERFDVALKAKPNCTLPLQTQNGIPRSRVIVQMSPALDGVAEHMAEHPTDRTFVASTKKPIKVERVLKESGAEVLINYLPVGSEEATRFYAECCLKTGVSLINCIPVFIASDPKWAKRFEEKHRH